MKTTLKDRALYFDGESAWSDDGAMHQFLKGNTDIFTLAKIKGFVQKTSCNQLPDKQWDIPDRYFKINLRDYFMELVHYESFAARDRALYELDLYEKKGMTDILRLMIYISDELNKNKIVWGVGRGSSVSSYLLYLLKIHLIDSFKYDLDIHDFLK